MEDGNIFPCASKKHILFLIKEKFVGLCPYFKSYFPSLTRRNQFIRLRFLMTHTTQDVRVLVFEAYSHTHNITSHDNTTAPKYIVPCMRQTRTINSPPHTSLEYTGLHFLPNYIQILLKPFTVHIFVGRVSYISALYFIKDVGTSLILGRYGQFASQTCQTFHSERVPYSCPLSRTRQSSVYSTQTSVQNPAPSQVCRKWKEREKEESNQQSNSHLFRWCCHN